MSELERQASDPEADPRIAERSTSAPVEAHFLDDLRRLLLRALDHAGFKVPGQPDVSRLALMYFEVSRRRIKPQPREVLWSTDLLRRQLDDATRAALEGIAADSRAGLDLNPRQSRFYDQADFTDLLFNDWGLLHLHLRSKGARDVLIVAVRDDALYFVDIAVAHRFNGPELLDVVNTNWPELLADAVNPSVKGLARPQPEPPERKELREAGIMTPVQLSDGTTLMGPGGGYSTAGFGFESRRLADNLLQWTADNERWCKANPERIASVMAKASGVAPSSLSLQLAFHEGELLIAVPAARVWFAGPSFRLEPLV
jgi:hypothetical protein